VKSRLVLLLVAVCTAYQPHWVWAGQTLKPGDTVDKNSGVVADPDWVPCIRDPNRGKMKHCSEEYRLCREAGTSITVCMAMEYPTLTPATKPSADEFEACRLSGRDEKGCRSILGDN
jgi:hypothetical protein